MRAGIVLAGGAGRRLGGVDKAVLEVGGTTMLDRVLTAMQPHCDELVVVGPPRATAIDNVRFTVEDELGGGPVPGMVAGLAASPNADTVVVVAVDLPLLTAGHVGVLLEGLTDEIDAVAAVDHRGRANPLLAVYAAGPLRSVVTGLGAGTPAARLLPARLVTVDLGEAGTLNVNEPDDLARARRLSQLDP